MDEITEYIGLKLSKLRKKQDPPWSQQDLADESGISYSTIWRLERGGNDVGVSISTLMHLAYALNVGIRELLPPGK